MIEAATVMDNLLPIGNKLPATESQARPLTALPPTAQREVWAAAVETAPNGKVTATHCEKMALECLCFAVSGKIYVRGRYR